MKVLFAISDEGTSEAIVKKYQKDYKEIISYKNVYYFNAILKEIERDKSYDRIVISEDLEPFANNNYETIDRFLFERLDGISDEAASGDGVDIPIILICTDRRSKTDSILLKLFSIGIYNAIIGQDRSIDEVCNLINKPRTKKDAKIYYKIEADDANYQSEDEDSVSEVEIQNIIAHYKRLGKNSERYVDSFNNIAAQYTDQQLKIIAKFLPLNVKAVLEAESPKYQEIMAFTGEKKKKAKAQARIRALQPGEKKIPKLDDIKLDLFENKSKLNEGKANVIIPTAIKEENIKKQKIEETMDLSELETVDLEEKEENNIEVEPVKRGRGRPKKIQTAEEVAKKEEKPKRGRGRPKKIKEEVQENKDIEEIEEKNNETIEEQPIDLFGLSDNDDSQEQFDEFDNLNFEDQPREIASRQSDSYLDSVNIENLITKDKKIVAFIGAR